MKTLILYFAFVFFGLYSFRPSFAFEANHLYRATDSLDLPLDELLNGVHKGQVIFVGELHGLKVTHDLQREVIKGLMARGFKVNVGIEHFSYLEQEALSAYLRGQLKEADLLKTVQLTGFENWKEQLFLPLSGGGWSYGLNAPRWLTSKIAAVGYDLLSALEKQILPADFTLGNEGYRRRSMEAMGMVHPSTAFNNIFAAQSAWDDTSAMTIERLMTADPESVMVVMFGDFHIAYNGGLPDRLTQRGWTDWISVSQFCVDGFSPAQLTDSLKPDAAYGLRATYLRPVICGAP
jgi:uncharacterized iron-regulated protein